MTPGDQPVPNTPPPPIRFDWRVEVPQWIVLAAVWIAAAVAWPHAPERIPVHWNVEGEVDRYGGRFEGLLLLPLIALATYLLLLFLPRIDPGRANYPRFQTAYGIIRLSMMLVFGGITVLIHLSMRGVAVDVGRLVPLIVGGLFVVLGGVLGKVQPNWFVGIRTPWTLSSRTAWERTHRVGAWAFLGAGLAVIAASLVSAKAAFLALVGVVPAVVVGVVAFSYFAWRAADDKQPPAGARPAA